eukprot:1641067-Prorocentrum_lima.AAC.1
MTSSLVGSEMCIRDRFFAIKRNLMLLLNPETNRTRGLARRMMKNFSCLLYTSDAADDMQV